MMDEYTPDGVDLRRLTVEMDNGYMLRVKTGPAINWDEIEMEDMPYGSYGLDRG